jgi:ADP-heptose:LPS heptosyltransferase
MIEAMLIEKPFMIAKQKCLPGELYLSSPYMRKELFNAFDKLAKDNRTENMIDKAAKFFMLDDLFKKATKDGNFKELLIVRYGGIGDIIALSSIIDYFEDVNIHFITQPSMFPIFDWFVKKPKLYEVYKPFLKDFKFNKKYDNWAKFQCEDIIEAGNKKNWFEIFFDAIEENDPDIEMLRPQLRTERIIESESGISCYMHDYTHKDKSLLICNKASSMMRTIDPITILEALPNHIKENYEIFLHEPNLNNNKRKLLLNDCVIIDSPISINDFLLDCFDADMVISIDSGALHFREAINKPAIGLYNSFTTDSRTKHYLYTKSFDIKSDCELQPCFFHATKEIKHCPKGTKEMFAAPCFDSKFNLTLQSQLTEIFENNL